MTAHGTLEPKDTRALEEWAARTALPLSSEADLDPLMERIGVSQYVLLGEASHGTREYYTWRAEISKRLITEKGFSFIAVEGDWPDCYRVNRFVKGAPGSGADAEAVLHAFDRWPTWMWANWEVVELSEWLRIYNDGQPPGRRAGFYGLDVYSLWDSLHAILDYLEKTDGSAVDSARRAFRCFQPYGEEAEEYAWASALTPTTCEKEVLELLRAICEKAAASSHDDGEMQFDAEQNALVARNAEHYYRTMIRGGAESWNIRDRHMVETLDRLMDHHGPDARCIVWEHNTHIGDARFTDMQGAGMVNVGQLVREAHGGDGVVLVGFGSYEGQVIAGSSWGAPMEVMPVPPAAPESWEAVFHEAGCGDSLFVFEEPSGEALKRRGHRAIGVVYDPDRERHGNYVPSILPHRYDAFFFIDRTSALSPLHLPVRHDGEVPETFPSGV